MGGTVSGGKAAVERNKERYGADYYKVMGARGGAAGTGNKGFATWDKERLSELGRRTGTIGRRGYTFLMETESGKQYRNKVTGEIVTFP